MVLSQRNLKTVFLVRKDKKTEGTEQNKDIEPGMCTRAESHRGCITNHRRKEG